MSFIDKFLDVMRLNDDEYDDYDDYDNDEEYDEEIKEKKSARRERKKEDKETTTEAPDKRQKTQNKITPISRNRKQGTGMEVCVIKPGTIEDEMEITETLLNGRTVVINMEGLSVDIAQRIIDFTSGATFAMHGNLQKISNYIFLATPSGVDISGDIQDLMESFDIPGFSM